MSGCSVSDGRDSISFLLGIFTYGSDSLLLLWEKNTCTAVPGRKPENY